MTWRGRISRVSRLWRAHEGRESKVIQVTVTGRHFEITDAIRGYVERKIGSLDRHFGRLQKADLVLAWENERVHVELTVSAPRGNVLVARTSGRDLYAGVDTVAHRMERQIGRLKERLQERRGGRSRGAPGGPGPDIGEVD